MEVKFRCHMLRFYHNTQVQYLKSTDFAGPDYKNFGPWGKKEGEGEDNSSLSRFLTNAQTNCIKNESLCTQIANQYKNIFTKIVFGRVTCDVVMQI